MLLPVVSRKNQVLFVPAEHGLDFADLSFHALLRVALHLLPVFRHNVQRQREQADRRADS